MAPPSINRPLRVFLCHVEQDIVQVRTFLDRLKTDGVDVWLSEKIFSTDIELHDKYPDAIREADVVLVCLSEKSFNKEGYFLGEMIYWMDIAGEKPNGNIYFIPIRLDKCLLPDRLKIFPWVDLVADQSIDQLNYLRLFVTLANCAREVGADFNFQETEIESEMMRTQPEGFAFNKASMKFLGLKSDQRLAMELVSLIRFIDNFIFKDILVSNKQHIFGSFGTDEFARVLKEWEKHGFLKWENGYILEPEIRSLIRSYIEKDFHQVRIIHETALSSIYGRLDRTVDDRRRLIIEELYHTAASKQNKDLSRILSYRLDQYPDNTKRSPEGWRIALEQMREAINHDFDLQEQIEKIAFDQLLQIIDIELMAIDRSKRFEALHKQRETDISDTILQRREMISKLTGPQFEKLWNALQIAFPTPEQLERMVLYKLDLNLNRIGYGDLENRTHKLIQWAEAQGQLARLVYGARQSNPENVELLNVAQELNLAIQTPLKRELQQIIRRENSFLDISVWNARLAAIEFQVCQVEIKLSTGEEVFGTGFLIGPRAVLTSFHTLQPVIERDHLRSESKPYAKVSDVVLRFDFKVDADGRQVGKGTEYILTEDDWLIDYSPVSPFDAEPGSFENDLPEIDQLDYALLRVDGEPGLGTIGISEPGGAKRGWIKIPQKPFIFQQNSALAIVQHPDTAPLKLALETQSIISTNKNGTRVRYKTNTEPGTSGAPCFSINWDLVAIHQTGDLRFRRNFSPEYNQGIPFDTIHQLWKKRNLLDKIQN